MYKKSLVFLLLICASIISLADDFDMLRIKRQQFIIDGPKIDLSDSYIHQKVSEVNSRAILLWKALDKNENRRYLWKQNQYLGADIQKVDMNASLGRSFNAIFELGTNK